MTYIALSRPRHAIETGSQMLPMKYSEHEKQNEAVYECVCVTVLKGIFLSELFGKFPRSA